MCISLGKGAFVYLFNKVIESGVKTYKSTGETSE